MLDHDSAPTESLTIGSGTGSWRHTVHADRIRALIEADPSDIRVQRVDPTCWRVIDAAAEPGDPGMLLGFVERDHDGFDCTLMAALQEHRIVGSLQAAHEYFEHLCGTRAEATC